MDLLLTRPQILRLSIPRGKLVVLKEFGKEKA
jgi:hypothetical protein